MKCKNSSKYNLFKNFKSIATKTVSNIPENFKPETIIHISI